MIKQTGFITWQEGLVLPLLIAGSIGWVWNIVKLMGNFDPITGMAVVRAIGVVVPPVGAIVGYL